MPRVIAIANDTEFTCWDRIGGDLLAMGFVEVLEDYTFGRRFHGFCKPKSFKYFTEEARLIHGFSYWKANEFPEAIETNERFLKWIEPLKGIDPTYIYHGNGKLDYRWMEEHLRKDGLEKDFLQTFSREKNESTLTMSRDYLKHIQEPTKRNKKGKLITKYSLPNICQFYGIDLDHHEVMSDTLACAQIWCNIKQGKEVWSGDLFK